MTIKELALNLNGCEYRNEITDELAGRAKTNEFVIVFGASDDLMEFRGAIDDEIGCYDGGSAYIIREGLLENKCEDGDCPNFETKKEKAKEIKAIWQDEDSPAWTYKTDIPHETFEILEDGEVYCRGIVFSLCNLHGGDDLPF